MTQHKSMNGLKPRAYMQRQERLPRSYAAIDAGWLTQFLAQRYPGVAVERLETIEFIDGHTSKARIRVELNEAGHAAGLPQQLCLKANWIEEDRSSAVCVQEARFYHDLPHFITIPAPRCYMADWDDDGLGQQGIIVLEDLVERGGTFSTSASGISPADAYKAVDSLADLHGSSWGRPELDRLDWLQTSVAADTPVDDYWMLLKDIIDVRRKDRQWLSILPAWIAEAPERLYAAFQQLCREERADSSPLCLIHGDAHLGNCYRTPNGERLWFDWQLPRRGRPWRDYSYFIIGSLELEDRRGHEQALFDHYFTRLLSHGVTLDRRRAWIDYRRWIVWGLIAWLTNINPNEPSQGPLNRFSRAAEDLDLAALFDV